MRTLMRIVAMCMALAAVTACQGHFFHQDRPGGTDTKK
jgi:hypothetical protein